MSYVWSIDIDGQPFIEPQLGGSQAGTGPIGFGELSMRQFRVVFSVDVAPGDTLSFADIRIYNLAKTSSIKQGSSIVLRAGYENNVDSIFTGFITNYFREREPGAPEIVTRLLCRSGQPVVDRASTRISFGPGTKVVEVLKALARNWPLPLDIDESQFASDPVFVSGYVVDGDIGAAFHSLANMFKFEWLQDRGRIVVTKPGMVRTTYMTQVDQYSGMVGIPEVSRGPDGLGLSVTVRLNPSLRINGRINVDSQFSTFNTGNLFVAELTGDANANGEYNIFALRHEGDSYGDTWNTEIDGIRPLTTPQLTQEVTSTNGKLVWGARVDQAFRVKIREIGQRLSIDPNWMMAVMGFETGYTFSPAARNPGSTAVGLIQFLQSTARSLGTTTSQLSRMTAVSQLDYVEAYFQQYASSIKNLGDAYMAVLWPAAISRPDQYVLWEKNSGPYQSIYAVNSGLDVGNKGYITRGDAVSSVNTSYQRGQQFVR